MRRDWKQNPVVIGALLAASALIWGAVLMRVHGADAIAPPSTVPATVTGPDAPISTGGALYPDVIRDPFAPLDDGGSADLAVSAPIPRASDAGHRLQGVIGQTALLVDPQGEAHLVRRGDAIGELEITGVHPTGVEVRLNGYRIDLSLD